MTYICILKFVIKFNILSYQVYNEDNGIFLNLFYAIDIHAIKINISCKFDMKCNFESQTLPAF